jgi:hypothetical protein
VPVAARHRPLTPSAALFALLTGLWSGLGIPITFGLEDAARLPARRTLGSAGQRTRRTGPGALGAQAGAEIRP